MGLFNFWKKKAKEFSLETLVNKIEELKNEFSSLKEQVVLEKVGTKAPKIAVIFRPNVELRAIINGDEYNSEVTTKEFYDELMVLVKDKDAAEVVRKIESTYPIPKKEVEKITDKDIETIVNTTADLVASGDFEVKDNSVYLKGINRSLPQALVDRFVLLNDEMRTIKDGHDESYLQYEAWKNYWYWIVTNPNAAATEKFYGLMNKYNVQVTKEGFVLAYRWVKLLESGSNKELNDFISNEWAKIKKWKKSPKNFEVYKVEEEYTTKLASDVEDYKEIGNLDELYHNLKESSDTVYTDGYTGKFRIKIGEEVSMKREDCDESDASCSRGLHNCFRLSDHQSDVAHDTKILTAICPRDIVSVPYENTSKFRSCRYMPLAVLKDNENEDFILRGEALDILEGYAIAKIDELKKEAEENTVKELTTNYILPEIKDDEVKSVIEHLEADISSRLVSID